MGKTLGLKVDTSPERRRAIHAAIERVSQPNAPFYVMATISATIAAYGLLSNSAAVVIGAMLVAPLMGPIFGMALGLTTGDRRLLGQAGLSETAGIVVVVLLAVLIGLMPLRMGFGAEIVSRTQPTLYDILIALASGLAGAYAMADERISPALPGVAIATALVPPLATCGLCLATARWDWALGAFLLFFSNFLAIQVAAAFVFVLFGMADPTHGARFRAGVFVRRFGLSLTLLVVVSAYLSVVLVRMVAAGRLKRDVQRALVADLRSTAGAQLSEVTIESEAGGRTVIATVLTPQEFEPAQVARMEADLCREVGAGCHLIVRSLIAKDLDRTGTLYLPDEDREQSADVARQTTVLRAASSILTARLAGVPGARLIDITREEGENGDQLTATVRAPFAIGPELVAELERAVRLAVKDEVGLVVCSVVTHTADAAAYRYEQMPASLTGGVADPVRQRIARALANQLRRRVAGTSLGTVRFTEQGRRLTVHASARGPRIVTPHEVAAMQADLRRYIARNIELLVDSSVGADASATGFQTAEPRTPILTPPPVAPGGP